MKCFCWLLLVLTACGQVRAQDLPVGVRLNVTRSQTNATLSWALPDSNLVLESATSLSSTDWQSVVEMLTITDGYCEVTVPLDQGQRYFRLRSGGAFSRSVGEGVSAPAVTNGYITAVLRSECTSAPRTPPPVGGIAVGPDYVIMTVADGDPLDYETAQQFATDAVFQSLMPLYCALTEGPRGAGCVTNRVQWNLVTYDAGGNPRISGSPVSGPAYHYCAVTNGYITVVVRGESAVLPPPPPVGRVAVGTDAVIMTIADSDPMDFGAAQRLATDGVFESLMRQYCALPRGTGPGSVSGRAQWIVTTYDVDGNAQLSGCATSGCDIHECVVTRGYITAVLRCSSVPRSPPPVGGIAVGPDYVIMTVADGDPLDYPAAQRVVTDAIFESLMRLYCGSAGCGASRVQWNLVTYDAGGNPRISGSPVSGPAYHYCAVTNGYITAMVRGESAVLPPLPPVGQVAVGTDAVIMTIADSDPMDLGAAQRLATDGVFESLMRQYCALPRGTGPGSVSGRAQWIVTTYDVDGNAQLSGCATSGCDIHECVVSRGYITAVLRSECTSAPRTPPPVGGIAVGPDYVIMTVADGDPLDYETAQQFATDAVFQSLMPLYCALTEGPRGAGCVTNRVQWNLLGYDAGGNPKLSGGPTSGPGFHYFGACSLTPEERIQNLIVWVKVDVAAGILERRDGHRLIVRLHKALRWLDHGNGRKAINNVKRFLEEVDAMVKRERLPAAAAQPLRDGALGVIGNQ